MKKVYLGLVVAGLLAGCSTAEQLNSTSTTMAAPTATQAELIKQLDVNKAPVENFDPHQ